jgi:hypothetical protein
MPRGDRPEWTRRKEPVADDYVMASVNQSGGPGMHEPESGHYAELLLGGLKDRDEAKEWTRALFRSAHWLTRHKVADVSVSTKIERSGTGYRIRYKAIDKTRARAHVLERYGEDRSLWPYDPRRRIAS